MRDYAIDEALDAPTPFEAPRLSPARGLETLLARLDVVEEDIGEVADIVRLAAVEIDRARGEVLRAAAVRLAEAEAEAREILEDARLHAEAMRAAGLAALRRRVDESERFLAPDEEPISDPGRHLRLARPLPTPLA